MSAPSTRSSTFFRPAPAPALSLGHERGMHAHPGQHIDRAIVHTHVYSCARLALMAWAMVGITDTEFALLYFKKYPAVHTGNNFGQLQSSRCCCFNPYSRIHSAPSVSHCRCSPCSRSPWRSRSQHTGTSASGCVEPPSTPSRVNCVPSTHTLVLGQHWPASVAVRRSNCEAEEPVPDDQQTHTCRSPARRAAIQ